MEYVNSLVLGIVQGISEFLPISSTGHLILTARLLGLTQTEFLKTFEIVIQLGSILSILFLYWKRFFVDRESLKRVIVAFIPTGILGFIFYKIIKSFLLSSETVVLWTLLLGGAFLIFFEIFYKEKPEAHENIATLPYKKAAILGLFQSIAMIPGVSRSAATIIGGLSLGLKRKTIVEFSFLLAVPTMLAASAFDLFKNAASFNAGQFNFLAIGFIASFIVSLLSVKFLLNFIKKHTFIPFGAYRIVAAIVFWYFIILK